MTATRSSRSRTEPLNYLITALSPGDRMLIAPHLEQVELARGQVLFEPGDEVTHVHFPCDTAMVSLVTIMRTGETAVAATIGREGAVGGVVSSGHLPAFGRAVVQSAGPAYRVRVTRLQEAKAKSIGMRNLLTRYADCLLAQVLESVACNALHSLEARCARWMLCCCDRTGTDVLPLTQEALAHMLGASRPYVSRALGLMEAQGMVMPGRGRITIVDRAKLEKTACECYVNVREHYATVLGAVYPEEDAAGLAS